MNIGDIAKLAGVSRATVSRYLNDGYVSTSNREKLSKIIEETGYVPSSHAKMLRTKKSGVIGVIAPKISLEAVSRAVSGISACLADTGYNMLLGNTNRDSKKEFEFLNIFKNNQVEGIIFIATTLTKKHYKLIKSLDIPVIIIGQEADGLSCVYNDDRNAARDAVNVLIRGGARRIAMLAADRADKAAGISRIDGYTDALIQNGITVDESLIAECAFTSDSGFETMQKMYSEHSDIDAVFCASDIIAIGAVSALKSVDVKIGKDVQLISIDNSKIADMLDISTAHLHFYTCGYEACKILLECLEEDQVPKKIMLGYEVIERGSTK